MPTPYSPTRREHFIGGEMKKIQDFIDGCVKSYQHSELVNYKRDITESKARVELLYKAQLFCFDRGTYTPSSWFKETTCCHYLPNPIQANKRGEFEDSYPFNNSFTLQLMDCNGLIIGMRDF